MSQANDNYEGSFGEFMSSIENQVKQFVQESSKAPKDLMEHWNAFSSAINWNENWIRCLLLSHLFLILTVILTRKNVDIQTFLFLIIISSVYFSERLNSYCSKNWELFSSQNYFDRQGVFAGIMFSAPLLFLLLFQLINFLTLTSSALITAKRLELKKKLKSEKILKEKEN